MMGAREDIGEIYRAQELLRKAGISKCVVVPVDQLADMYGRFKRLTKMGQCTIEGWLAMPKEVADLRHQIFREADFGAVFAGQWLPRAARKDAQAIGEPEPSEESIWLRRLLTWCRARLKRDEYKAALDRYLDGGPSEPDSAKVVQS